MSIIEEGDGLSVDHEDTRPLLQRIKERRAEDTDILTIDIPTWGSELKAQYRVVDPDEIEKMVRRIRARQSGLKVKDPEAGMNADLDFLINACVGVVAYDIENDSEELLTPGFTPALTEMLDKTGEITSARELLGYLISVKIKEPPGWKPNGIAIAAHGQKVARWMQDTSKPVEDPQ